MQDFMKSIDKAFQGQLCEHEQFTRHKSRGYLDFILFLRLYTG